MIDLALLPHDGVKHRTKKSSYPLAPDGYALSPTVKTALGTFAALSALRTLSTSAAVASSPALPQTAMSPAPIITAAPASAISAAGAPAAGGVLFSGGQATPKNGITARSSDRFRSLMPNRRLRLRSEGFVM